MRAEIHPTYETAHVRCSCGNEFMTRATKPEITVEVALQCDFEALILRTGTMIGEVQGLLDERIQISSLPVAAATA